MAISPNSFFNTDATAIIASNAERDRTDARLSSDFQLLVATIIRLTSELGNFSKFIIAGQKQENKIIDDYAKEVDIKNRLSQTGISGIGQKSISDVSSSIADSAGLSGDMPSMSILGGAAVAGGLGALIASFFQGGGTSDGGGSEDFSGSTGEDKTMSYLISQGLTPAQAAGVAGNLKQESRFNPNITNDNGHTGIAQWSKDRWPKVSQYIQSIGKDPRSLEGQLSGLKWEAEQRGDWSKIKNAKNEKEAARIFLDSFEVSGEKPGQAGYENRMTYSSDILKRYQPQSSASSKSSNSMVSSSGVRGTPGASGAPGSSGVSGTSSADGMDHKATEIKVADSPQTKAATSLQVASSIVPRTESDSSMIAVLPVSSQETPKNIVPARRSVGASGTPSSHHWLSDIARLNMGIAMMG